MRSLTKLVLLAVLVIAPVLNAQQRGQSAIVDLSELLVDYLGRVEKKLVDDKERWTKSMDLVESSAEDLQNAAVLDRQQSLRAEAILRYRNAWKDEAFRRPILLRIAEVDMAMDQVSQAELARLRAINARRSASFDALVELVRQLKTGQQELTAYLKDSSLSRKLGEIDVSLVSVAITEAKTLRTSLAGEEATVNLEAERGRLQKAIDGFRNFLDYVDQVNASERGTE